MTEYHVTPAEWTYLDHYTKDAREEGAQQHAIHGKEHGRQCTNFPKATNFAVGADNQNGDFERVVPNDRLVDIRQRFENDLS
jgi:hypothetical protein